MHEGVWDLLNDDLNLNRVSSRVFRDAFSKVFSLKSVCSSPVSYHPFLRGLEMAVSFRSRSLSLCSRSAGVSFA